MPGSLVMRAGLALFCGLAFGAPAMAADLAPDAAAIAVAAGRGARAWQIDAGYPLKSHLLYAVRDARAIDPADGEVDAVVVATPLERTAHAAFVAARTGRSLSASDCYRSAGLPPGHLAIIVYAHGDDADDDRFASAFGQASIVFPDGIADAVAVDRGAPSEGLYPLAEKDRMRKVALVTYRFDLGRWPDAGRRSGRLLFTDGGGKHFDIPLDLSQFE